MADELPIHGSLPPTQDGVATATEEKIDLDGGNLDTELKRRTIRNAIYAQPRQDEYYLDEIASRAAVTIDYSNTTSVSAAINSALASISPSHPIEVGVSPGLLRVGAPILPRQNVRLVGISGQGRPTFIREPSYFGSVDDTHFLFGGEFGVAISGWGFKGVDFDGNRSAVSGEALTHTFNIVYFKDSTNLSEDFLFEDCTIRKYSDMGMGIATAGLSKIRVRRSKFFDGGHKTTHFYHPIYLSRGYDLKVIDNDFEDGGGCAVKINGQPGGDSKAIVSKNRIDDFNRGVTVTDFERFSVEDNIITDVEDYGIITSTDDTRNYEGSIRGNQLKRCGFMGTPLFPEAVPGCGIYASAATGLDILHNRLMDCPIGIQVRNATYANIFDNVFSIDPVNDPLTAPQKNFRHIYLSANAINTVKIARNTFNGRFITGSTSRYAIYSDCPVDNTIEITSDNKYIGSTGGNGAFTQYVYTTALIKSWPAGRLDRVSFSAYPNREAEGPLAGRDAFDAQAAGFRYLETSPALQMWTRSTGTTGVWSGPVAIAGGNGLPTIDTLTFADLEKLIDNKGAVNPQHLTLPAAASYHHGVPASFVTTSNLGFRVRPATGQCIRVGGGVSGAGSAGYITCREPGGAIKLAWDDDLLSWVATEAPLRNWTVYAASGRIGSRRSEMIAWQRTVAAGDTIANTAVETAFVSAVATIPAFLLREGSAIKIKASGRMGTAAAAGTLVRKAKLGGVEAANSGTRTMTNSLSNAEWSMKLDIFVETAGAAGSGRSTGRVWQYSGANAFVNIPIGDTSIAINTDVDLAIALPVTWGTADAANTVTMTQFSVEVCV